MWKWSFAAIALISAPVVAHDVTVGTVLPNAGNYYEWHFVGGGVLNRASGLGYTIYRRPLVRNSRGYQMAEYLIATTRATSPSWRNERVIEIDRLGQVGDQEPYVAQCGLTLGVVNHGRTFGWKLDSNGHHHYIEHRGRPRGCGLDDD